MESPDPPHDVILVPDLHMRSPHPCFGLAQMYALTMSVSNLSLPFSLVSSYMVSDPKTQSPTEAWAWVEDLTAGSGGASNPSAVCAGADAATLPTATRNGAAVALPTVLHYWCVVCIG